MQIRSIIIRRQQDMIDKLKVQLVTAKSVLKNPRLKKVAHDLANKSCSSRTDSSMVTTALESSENSSKPCLPTIFKTAVTPSKRKPLNVCQAPEEANSGVLCRVLPAHLKLSK
jgi:hypothetical protein